MNRIIEQINKAEHIDTVCEIVSHYVKSPVYFDDSRAWSVYCTKKPTQETHKGTAQKYGAYRPYLGGGIRGAICTNLTGDLGNIFKAALAQIEKIYNQDDRDIEPWELSTGVLL